MNMKVIELKKSILEDNDSDADLLRDQLREEGTCYVNVMSSPGAGKTSLPDGDHSPPAERGSQSGSGGSVSD